jgi:hypothetical protein
MTSISNPFIALEKGRKMNERNHLAELLIEYGEDAHLCLQSREKLPLKVNECIK